MRVLGSPPGSASHFTIACREAAPLTLTAVGGRLRGWCVCRACREFATILHRDLAPVLDEMDCKLLVVSIGTAARAKQFVAETGFPLERVSE